VPPNIREAVKGSDVHVGVRVTAMGPDMTSLANAERQMIMSALRRHGNNRTKAAEELGISRRTLHRKLRQYNEELADEESAP